MRAEAHISIFEKSECYSTGQSEAHIMGFLDSRGDNEITNPLNKSHVNSVNRCRGSALTATIMFPARLLQETTGQPAGRHHRPRPPRTTSPWSTHPGL